MNETDIDPEERRKLLRVLNTSGPMSHEELSREVEHDWDDVQQMIRDLRKEGLVTITLDRRYEADSAETELTA